MIEDIFKPRNHEIAILSHFGDASFYDGTCVSDTPLYLLGFSNRSGSNLMAEYLASTKKFAHFREDLNSDIVIKRSENLGIDSFPGFITSCVSEMTAGGALPGFKANWAQVVMLHRFGVLKMFPSVRLINMVRKDILGQAISFSIASQTGQWVSCQKIKREPEFIFNDVGNRLFGTLFGNWAMDTVAQAIGLDSMSVFYEDLESDPLKVISDIAGNFRVDIGSWTPSQPVLKRQRTPVNDMMKEQFFEEFREKLGRRQ